MVSPKGYTGRTRQRKTAWTVRAGDIVSRILITFGGIGTILAVSLVCVFLVFVAYPLFLPASIGAGEMVDVPWHAGQPWHFGVDEYQLLGWVLNPDGTLSVFRLDTGKVVEQRKLFKEDELTAFSPPSGENDVAFGFKDGKLRLGQIRFVTETLIGDEVPKAFRDLSPGAIAEHAGGVVQGLAPNQLRWQKLQVDFTEAIEGGSDAPVRRLDHVKRDKDTYCAILAADGKLYLNSIQQKKSLTTGKTKYEVETTQELPLASRNGKGLPKYLLISALGNDVYAAWQDGVLHRYHSSDNDPPKLEEEVSLTSDADATLTALQFLIARTTLVAGDSSGRVRGWFETAQAGAPTSDGAVLTLARTMPGRNAAVSSLGMSARSRMVTAGYADGMVRVFFMTNGQLMAEVAVPEGVRGPVVAMAPKDNGLAALTPAGLWRWPFNAEHPEATLRALFRPVWYEGDPAPSHTWQATGGYQGFEPKFGMWVLVFGTIKATFYSLLMAVPLALLSAIYTSEFLHPRAKAVVKPTIELMASLPSVVLGFLAALVFAPFVARWLPSVLACFLTVPGAFLVGAYLWQMLPEKLYLRLSRWRFAFITAFLPVGLAAAALLGPVLEKLLFEGDIKAWLNGTVGTGTSGWLILLLPLSGVGLAVLMGSFVNPWLRKASISWDRGLCAVVALVKFVAAAAVTVALAWLAGTLLTALGVDPRGSVFGRYDQRNALVVGLVMGFAVIPIIYTVAEDALSAVPEHLRSASLGCGATPWQTAVRIIIPTAMSGMFSAVMIGLGRAVGETMIVLMATGNTPVLEWNIFNGFRTLAANIAVELPEAPAGGTHYRTLFLAALTLFAMTFVLNTIAEAVRQRFRKRAYQL